MWSNGRLPRLLMTGALAVLVACASSPGSAESRALSGCYYFEQGEVSRELRLPWGIRLEDAPLEGWPALQQREGVKVATTLTGRGEADFPFGYWLPTAADSVEIGYPAGGGLLLELRVVERDLTGVARPVGDVLTPGGAPSRAQYPVHLMWARCPED